MTDKELIKQDIKRRISNLEKLGNREYIKKYFTEQFRFIEVYEGLIKFIDSLPEEPASEDLEKEITKCYKSRNDLMMTREQFGKIIRHFTEWQKQQLIDKACEWLNDWLESDDFGIPITASSRKLFLKEFKEAMEEQ